jgi:hypothetical protein
MKRSPLKRRTPLARGTVGLVRTPLAKVGKKVKRDRAELAAARVVVEERSSGRCEFWMPGVFTPIQCEAPAVHLHHVQRRSQGGSNDPRNLVHLCAHHHQLIRNNPAWAMDAGWLARAVS